MRNFTIKSKICKVINYDVLRMSATEPALDPGSTD